jgi:hypothetical protein
VEEFHGRVTSWLKVDAHAALDLITDLERLPLWNAAVDQLLERPTVVTVGAEWVTLMHPRRSPSWKSRSRVDNIDREHLRFAYTSRNEDGTPPTPSARGRSGLERAPRA